MFFVFRSGLKVVGLFWMTSNKRMADFDRPKVVSMVVVPEARPTRTAERRHVQGQGDHSHSRV